MARALSWMRLDEDPRASYFVSGLPFVALLAWGAWQLSGQRWELSLTCFVATVAYGGAFLVHALVRRRRIRRWRAEWSAIAEPMGFRAEMRKGSVAILGSVASRPFELDYQNGITYGLDSELGMRASVEDPEARLLILTHETSRALSGVSRPILEMYGDLQAPSGDAEFDAAFCVRANPAGQAVLARCGPAARRVLVDCPQLEVFLSGGSAWIRLGSGELRPSYVLAAHRLLSSLIGATPVPTTRTPTSPAG